MKTIAVSSLRPGLTFTEPVYIDDINLLVPANIAVRKKDIQQLISWGIETVATDGDVIASNDNDNLSMVGVNVTGEGKPIPQAVYKTTNTGDAARPSAEPIQKKTISILSLREVQENQEDYRTYLKLIEELDKVFDAYIKKKDIPVRSIDVIANGLLTAVREQKGRIIGFILGSKVQGHDLAKSSVNAAILSARIAMALKLAPHKILQVISGSLLHDIGMLKLPKNLLEREGELSDGELQLIQAHPLASYRIICKELGLPDDAGVVACQHHERWDGKGYPGKLAGANIDLRARIVAVADAFEAMVSEKPYHTPMEGSRAIKALYADNGRRFDPEVLKAFIRTMGIYPIGAFVKLNNNAICRVLSVEANALLQPRVEVLIDENDRTFRPGEGKVYDLIQEKDIFISYALDPKEIAKHS
ncbi:MAG: HD-GYP domain-containing protein [Treponema sp.]|jgi:HD-GYP domain-containing protein (c-di-GMP phosphodiesterase class II)|nr:HD-GYP domain-containing protein [Treponema sp.]